MHMDCVLYARDVSFEDFSFLYKVYIEQMYHIFFGIIVQSTGTHLQGLQQTVLKHLLIIWACLVDYISVL